MNHNDQAELGVLQQANKELQTEKNNINEQLNRTTEELVSLRATSGQLFILFSGLIHLQFGVQAGVLPSWRK